jgi:hypothetical protein
MSGYDNTNKGILGRNDRKTQDNHPDFSGSIGGISGGPVLDARGHVVGVIVAETPRRGRFETIAPEVLAAGASRPLPVGDPSAREVDLSPRTLPGVADTLRDRLRVAQAVCIAG